MINVGDRVKITDEKYQPGRPFDKIGHRNDMWPSVGEIGIVEDSYEYEHGFYKEWVNIIWVRFPDHQGSWPFAAIECEVISQP